MSAPTLGRRPLATLLAGALAAPAIIRGARAASRLVIRNTGGAYDEVMRRGVYDPFTQATGIDIVGSGAPMTKMIATVKAGGAEYDLIDSGMSGLVALDQMGALSPIDYASWTFAKPDDFPADLRGRTSVACFVFSTVLVANMQSFPDRRPRNWAEFWDTKAFPGPRTLPDFASGSAPLEFALLADGVPMDKLYPIDMERAFRVLSRLRDSIPKFWSTGALGNQLMSDKEVLLGGLWNGQMQTLIDKGVPLALEWNQNMMVVEGYGILKSSPNQAAAQKFIDFASQPSAQIGYAKDLRYGPANPKAFDLIPQALADTMPGSPRYKALGFYESVEWWNDNRDRVNKAWSTWMLG